MPSKRSITRYLPLVALVLLLGIGTVSILMRTSTIAPGMLEDEAESLMAAYAREAKGPFSIGTPLDTRVRHYWLDDDLVRVFTRRGDDGIYRVSSIDIRYHDTPRTPENYFGKMAYTPVDTLTLPGHRRLTRLFQSDR